MASLLKKIKTAMELPGLLGDVCATPIFLLGSVENGEVQIVAGVGVEAETMNIDDQLFAWLRDEGNRIDVSDAQNDISLSQSRYVFGPPFIRTFSARALTAGGQTLGFLAIASSTLQPLEKRQSLMLDVLARQISCQLDLLQRLESLQHRIASTFKMSALGEMAAGIAHEMNNPLSAILQRAGELMDLAAEEKLEATAVAGLAEKIEKIGVRMRATIKGLRSFARDGDNDRLEKVSLKSILEDTLELCQARLKSQGIDLRIQWPGDSVVLNCRTVQISQVLLNLLNNAHDAVKDLPEKWVEISYQDDDQTLSVFVSDSGHIPTDLREKIMEPFFTTKPPGQGTGLGLSISQRILHAHGGSLEIVPDSPFTRFKIDLKKSSNS